ncbi:ribosomal protein S18-alanine N-acetyltransferase [Piscinibacter sakaiensis]|nr:ribosomal protein S18-alanine N-acetyltransferase [Piscinibacter sakaiensis]
MDVRALDEVLEVERAAYEFPWSRGNFVDSLHAGYAAWLLHDEHPGLAGYAIAMAGVDEVHLLNLTVAPPRQREGHARWMLEALVAWCRLKAAPMLWLEVRTSNARARTLYGRFGFREIGTRRAYYPAAQGRREDAVVMSLAIDLPAGPPAPRR